MLEEYLDDYGLLHHFQIEIRMRMMVFQQPLLSEMHKVDIYVCKYSV